MAILIWALNPIYVLDHYNNNYSLEEWVQVYNYYITVLKTKFGKHLLFGQVTLKMHFPSIIFTCPKHGW